MYNKQSHHSFPRISKENCVGIFQRSLNFCSDTWSISDVRRLCWCAHSWLSSLLQLQFPPSFAPRQLRKAVQLLESFCKSPFSGYHEYFLKPSAAIRLLVQPLSNLRLASIRPLEQHEGSRSTANRIHTVCNSESTKACDLVYKFATRKCDQTARRPLESSAAKRHSRERSKSCLVCAQCKSRTCLRVSPFRRQFRLSDRRAQTTSVTEALEQLLGTILRQNVSEEGERSTEHKKNVAVQRKSYSGNVLCTPHAWIEVHRFYM